MPQEKEKLNYCTTSKVFQSKINLSKHFIPGGGETTEQVDPDGPDREKRKAQKASIGNFFVFNS